VLLLICERSSLCNLNWSLSICRSSWIKETKLWPPWPRNNLESKHLSCIVSCSNGDLLLSHINDSLSRGVPCIKIQGLSWWWLPSFSQMGIKYVIVRKSEDQAHAEAVLLMARTVCAWQQAIAETYLISWDLKDTLALIYLVGN